MNATTSRAPTARLATAAGVIALAWWLAWIVQLPVRPFEWEAAAGMVAALGALYQSSRVRDAWRDTRMQGDGGRTDGAG